MLDALLANFALTLLAQSALPPPTTDPAEHVSPPALLHSVKPEFTKDARENHVQGTVTLEIVIDEKGTVSETSIISPLGFGLDDEARKAVSQWRFQPARKNNVPVRLTTIVEMNFRLQGIDYDAKAERARTRFNSSLRILAKEKGDTEATTGAVRAILQLSDQGYPPAMFLAGLWRQKGERVPADPPGALVLIEKAAAKKYGPALYQLAAMRIGGKGLPQDTVKGLEQMHQAARLGSKEAQFVLAGRYETSQPPEPARARDYYRLCAAQRMPVCQYKLGRLLLARPNREESDWLQAIALLELAAAGDFADAATLVAGEQRMLTARQKASVEKWKAALVPK